jgi:hypothetical protein
MLAAGPVPNLPMNLESGETADNIPFWRSSFAGGDLFDL